MSLAFLRTPAAAIVALGLIASPVVAQQIPTIAGQPGQPTTPVAAGTYEVDPMHTQVAWEVNHLGFSMLEGLFPVSAGTLTIDPANLKAAKVSVTIPIDQIAVTAAPFANHLKSAEIFNVAANPTATFVSTSVTPTGKGKATIAGTLTIKGVAKPVTLQASFVGAGVNPLLKKANIGFSATTTIKRSDFGLGLYAPLVSDTVALHIHAAFVK